MIQECLDLRKRYLYREEVVPWIVARTNSIASGKKSDPFHFEPVEASSIDCEIEDGVLVLIGEKKRGGKKRKRKKGAFKKKHLSSASSKTTQVLLDLTQSAFAIFAKHHF
ncbi:unnamed protein product [Prunus brigantina]